MPTAGPARLSVERIGGIDKTTVELEPGVSVLTGRNATNRTSLLQGLMGALGSDDIALKADAEEGRVRLDIDENTYTRTLTREGDDIRFAGDPYLDDPTVADLFAFLLESNEARRAVAEEGDLRELIMRPVDTNAIHEEIADLRSERQELEERIDTLSALESDASALRIQRDELEERIEALESELQERRSAVQRMADMGDESGAAEQIEQLREANAELEEAEFELDAERDSLAALEEEADEVRAELSEYPTNPAAERQSIAHELDELRDRKSELDTTISGLQRTIQFNERLLDDDSTTEIDVRETLGDDDETDRIVCWTCGSNVQRDAISDTVEQLRTLRDERREERSDVVSKLESLRTRQSELEEVERQRRELESRLEAIESEREERESRIADLEEHCDELRTTTEALREEMQAADADEQSALLDAHREVNRLEFNLEEKREEHRAIVDELEELESELSRRSEFETRQDEIKTRIDDLRTRIEEVERSAIAEFNDHIAQVLNILEYSQLSRIWIERQQPEASASSRFVLHIERRTDSGRVYEDIIDHLSESEREVTGLVFALAGYLVHDVYETVPFLVFDSLEAIDAERIDKFVNYVKPYADYLVVALLSEDAQALPDAYHRIRNI